MPDAPGTISRGLLFGRNIMVEKETMKKRRKKGDGSITMKENGTYLGRITIAGYEPFSCTGLTRKEVERKLGKR